MISTTADQEAAIAELRENGGLEGPVLVQQFITGPVEHVQAVFRKGRLAGIHMYRQVVRGAGGGDAVKESVWRDEVQDHVSRIGKALKWHGGLSLDYIVADPGERLVYIDCNPRLVEPMSARLAGADLAGLLVGVSLGDGPKDIIRGQPGTRTHLAMQALLGCALRTGSRRAVLRECLDVMLGRGAYDNSREELTPVRTDWQSGIPLLMTAVMLLFNPGAAEHLPKRGWGRHLLTPPTVAVIEKGDFA
jgi:hypothetical protein